jgi:hypothetical protein
MAAKGLAKIGAHEPAEQLIGIVAEIVVGLGRRSP